MVGGEKTQDTELKAKRNRRKKNMEKRMKILSDALKNVDDEDGVMLKVYDDIHEELRVKTELAKRQKAKVRLGHGLIMIVMMIMIMMMIIVKLRVKG